MAHAPGPWEARPHDGQIVLNGSNCYAVQEIYNDQGGFNPDDIRLMATAPELLASLRWLVSSAKMRSPVGGWAYMIPDRAMDEARAAIAKAEGITTEVDDGKERSLD